MGPAYFTRGGEGDVERREGGGRLRGRGRGGEGGSVYMIIGRGEGRGMMD